MPTKAFDFTGTDGQRLSGRLDEPDGPASAYALFAHCFTCTKDSIAAVRISRALTALGYGVLRFDFTGLGQSGGEFADSNFSGSIADLVAAADAMRAAGHAPALLIGHSLGGAAVLAAAAHIPETKAVATIGAPSDVDHVTRLFAGDVAELEAKGEAEVRIGGRPFKLRRSFLDDLAAHDQAERIRALGKPLLILHSPQDATVGIDNATAIYRAARHPRSFVALDGADHLLTDRRDAEFAAAIIAAWASRYVADPAPARSEKQSGAVTVVETGEGAFQVEVSAGGARFLADEPPEVGGLGSGPTPYDLLAAGLGACTAMTLRLYARGKQLPLDRVSVTVGHSRRRDAAPADLFTRRLQLHGDLTDAQRQRLVEIAEKCPVHRTLAGGAAVETELGEAMPDAAAETPGQHARDMAATSGAAVDGSQDRSE
ncbi:alpha/beta fold hydrolase [Sphingosinicella sp. LY1275]|uniref:bifunctional alpha/beta hydrolase/OsmC family protein n=1 Tax=Sphingosinicella sp. LY1275 TaxID=3095379 RepID=UPI002ADED8DE|nr:alpha/beta fold hydrolase [Sphingosinicella sp. LY1275]MEA1015620.1 alpha/beta fold hydrolase [Sphingosinicella sp. LY1275]